MLSLRAPYKTSAREIRKGAKSDRVSGSLLFWASCSLAEGMALTLLQWKGDGPMRGRSVVDGAQGEARMRVPLRAGDI